LDERRKLFGRYASDPFQKQQGNREKVIDAFSNLKGFFICVKIGSHFTFTLQELTHSPLKMPSSP